MRTAGPAAVRSWYALFPLSEHPYAAAPADAVSITQEKVIRPAGKVWRALRDSNPRPLDPKPEKWGHREHPVTPNLLCYLLLTQRQFSDVCPVLGCFGVSTIQKLYNKRTRNPLWPLE